MDTIEVIDNSARKELRHYVERLESLEEDKKAISDDIKDVLDEAAGKGFDKQVLKMILRRRKKSRNTVAEMDSILAVYEGALSDVES